MRGCLVFGVCHVLSCLLCLIHVLIFFFFFFFETDHAVHGLPQIALCVYSGGGLGFLGWGGFFVALKKNLGLLSCSSLCTAL